MTRGNLVFAVLSIAVWSGVLLFASDFGSYLLCSLLLLAVGLLFLHHSDLRSELMLNQIAFLAVLGPVGAIAGAGMLAATYLRAPHDPDERTEWYRELSGRDRAIGSRDVVKDIDAGRLRPQFTGSIQSAHELMLSGTSNQKREILKWIVRRRDPALYPLLEIAVKGPDPIVRSQAASILVRLRRDQALQAPVREA